MGNKSIKRSEGLVYWEDGMVKEEEGMVKIFGRFGLCVVESSVYSKNSLKPRVLFQASTVSLRGCPIPALCRVGLFI